MASEYDKTLPNIPLDVPGAAGVVTIGNWKTSKPFIAVNAVRIVSGLGSTFKIPMADGTEKKAKIKMSMLGYFLVQIDGKRVFESEKLETGLVVVSLTPLLNLILLGGLFGFALAFGLVTANYAIIRNENLSRTARYLLPLALAAVGAVVAVMIGIAVLASRGEL